MTEEYIPLVIFTLFIIAIALGFYFSKYTRIKRKLKNATYRDLAKFKDNEIAKITGNVELIEMPLISPLSKRKCALYDIRIKLLVLRGKGSRWKTIIEERVSNKFVINSDNNYAYINDKNIKFQIVQDKKYSSGTFKDTTVNLEKYLQLKGIKSVDFLGFNKPIKYYEGIFEIGEEIAVLGKGIWREASELGLPKKYGKVLEITSTKDMAVYVSDDPYTTKKNTKTNNIEKRSIDKKRYQK